MPPEPNEKIDDLLKRYVAQRKSESSADFELHPATRILLQGEVTRTFPKTDDAEKKSPFLLLWPRLAIVGAFTAMLVATVVVLNSPNPRRTELAQSSAKERAIASLPSEVMGQSQSFSDTISERKDLAKSEIPASISEQPKRLAEERKIAGRSSVSNIETRSAAKLSEPAGPAKSKSEYSDEAAKTKSVIADTFARTANDFVSVETGETSKRPAAPVATSRLAEVASQNRWHFLQQDLRAKYRRNLLSPAQPKILQSFELVRNGNKIRLVDGDGSIYDGEILIAAQEPGKKDVRDKNEKASAFSFRAAGTNQPLKQIVNITGEFLGANADLEEKNLGRNDDAIQLETLKKQSQLAPGGVIQGKVSIGGTNEFEIRATTKR